MSKTDTTKTAKRYGNTGDIISGRERGTGRRWTAVVGPSGKLIKKTYY